MSVMFPPDIWTFDPSEGPGSTAEWGIKYYSIGRHISIYLYYVLTPRIYCIDPRPGPRAYPLGGYHRRDQFLIDVI